MTDVANGKSRTSSMYADEKSDEAVVTDEATEQREETPGGGRGGKGLTQVKQPTGGRGSDTEPSCHVDPIGGCAPERRGGAPTFDPREEILCRRDGVPFRW